MAASTSEVGPRTTPEADLEELNEAELGEARQVQATLQERDVNWRSDTFLFFCRVLNIVTGASALLCMIVHIAAIVRSVKRRPDVFEVILRVYAAFFAGFAALTETEWERIFRFWKMLDYWAGRGIFLTFVAVMTKALSHESKEGSFESTVHVVASYMLLGCGLFYFVAGLLCFGRLKRTRAAKLQRLQTAVRDLQEVEKKRKELEGLLAESGRQRA